jgi:DNA-binding transcriptional LysR family regulator
MERSLLVKQQSDLNRIRQFVHVAEAGSFTAASRIAGLPKSSLSRAVAALERELGVRLIQRTTRRLHLTDAGRAYYETASRALAGLDEAAAAASQLQDTPRGTVRLTAPDIGVWLLPAPLARFAERYPEIAIDVTLTQRVVDLVHEGFDLALRVGKLPDTGLVARPLGLVRTGLFASRDYLKRRGRPRSLADLAAHDCVLFRAERGRAVWDLVGPAGRQNVEVRGALGADDHPFVREAAAAGRGITLLPIFACSGPFADPGLVRVLGDYATAGAPLHLVYPSARFLPKRVALLRDLLVAELPRRLKT